MEEKNTTPASTVCKSNDLRTFLIAFLTAVIVIALYHFGTGIGKMFCPENACGAYRPVQRYMLVPVMESPYGYPGACGGKKFGCGPGFRNKSCEKQMKSCPAPSENPSEQVSPK